MCEGGGEVVAGTLLDAMNTPKTPAGSPRYVYPARSMEGWVSHWQASMTLPQGPALTGEQAVPAITARCDRRSAGGSTLQRQGPGGRGFTVAASTAQESLLAVEALAGIMSKSVDLLE